MESYCDLKLALWHSWTENLSTGDQVRSCYVRMTPQGFQGILNTNQWYCLFSQVRWTNRKWDKLTLHSFSFCFERTWETLKRYELGAYLSPLIFSLGVDCGMVSGRLTVFEILRMFSIGTPRFLKRVSSWVISSSFWKDRKPKVSFSKSIFSLFSFIVNGGGVRWIKTAEFESRQSTYIKEARRLLPLMAYTGRLCPKLKVTLFRLLLCKRIGISQVEAYERGR